MYLIDGRQVSSAEYLASEQAFEEGYTSYIRPVYRNDAFVGFAVFIGGEAIGKVFSEYKLAAQLLDQIRSES